MTIADLIFTVSVDSDGARAGLNDIGNQAESMSESAGNAMDGVSASTIALGNIMAEVAKKVVSAVISIGKTAIEYNAQMENYTARLTTALGSQQAAVEAIAAIKADAATSVYDTAGLVEANSLLMSTGLNAKESRKAINALGVAVAASGGGNDVLARMAQNLQQIKNVGKATSMDIRQFAMAGIDIYGLLADYTGKSVAEVQELDITYDMLVESLEMATKEGGKYFGAMEAQMSTFNGQVSMLKSNVEEKLGQAFEGISAALSTKVLPALNEFVANADISEITTRFIELGTVIATLFVGANITQWVTKAKSALALLAADPVFLVAAAIAGVTVATIEGVRVFNKYTDSLSETDGTAEGVTQRLEELRAKETELQEAMDSGWGTEMVQDELDATRIAISRLEKQMGQTAEAGTVAVEDTSSAVEGILAEFESGYDEIMAAYTAAYEATMKNVSGWFSVFEEVKQVVPQGVEEMNRALQSQIEFNNTYAENLQFLRKNGMEDLATAFQEMGSDGAQYAANLVKAFKDGDTDIIATFDDLYAQVQESREKVASELTDLTGEYDKAFEELVKNTEDAIDKLELSDEARTNAINTMAAYAAGIKNDTSSTTAAYNKGKAIADAIQKGVNDYGTITINATVKTYDGTNHATGLEFVPYDEYPALLHKGERVLTASEAKEYNIGGGSGITINQTISSTPQTPVELAAAARAYFEEAKWAV